MNKLARWILTARLLARVVRLTRSSSHSCRTWGGAGRAAPAAPARAPYWRRPAAVPLLGSRQLVVVGRGACRLPGPGPRRREKSPPASESVSMSRLLTPHLLNERVCLEAVLLLARQEVHDVALAAELLVVAPLGTELLQTEAPGLAGRSCSCSCSCSCSSGIGEKSDRLDLTGAQVISVSTVAPPARHTGQGAVISVTLTIQRRI